MNLLDWLGTISGYKRRYELCSHNYAGCVSRTRALEYELECAQEIIRQLELLTPGPPPPEIDSIAQQDGVWVGRVLADMNLGIQWLQLDGTYYLTNETNFLNIVAWEWTDRIPWEKEVFDCENHAIRFKSVIDEVFHLNQVGIVISYKAGHAFNIVIFPDGKVMLLEPQSDVVYFYPKFPKQFYDLEGAIVLI